MVKGMSRRVVVVESPDRRFFEQAIFVVRDDAMGKGVSSQQLVEEAKRVARNYSSGHRTCVGRFLRNLRPAAYTLLGAGGIGGLWLLTALL